MSGDCSGSGLNLRDFRIQKKPVLSHKPITGPAENTKSPIANGLAQMWTSTTRPQKNPEVLEKERQMRFLMQSFPKADTMAIHNVLSRHNFDTDAAAAELAENRDKSEKACSYQQWRREQDRIEAERLAEQTRRQKEYLDKLKNKVDEDKKRKVEVVVNKVVRAETSLPRPKRQKVDDVDSDDSGGADYRDARVYNSDDDSDVEITNDLTSDKKSVLEFLQKATPNELQLMASCSKKKVEALIELRPFNSWTDLVQKLQEHKSLGTELLNSAQQVLTTRNNIKQLMKKCTNLAQQMERAVANGVGLKNQPHILAPGMKLTSYQLLGLNWLSVLHTQGVNGILADEMGLGKTIQVIAFLAYLKERNEAKEMHLVVVPSSTLDNWRVEFERWCPDLKVFMYYGSTEERREFRINFAKGLYSDYDVMLTTYTMVGNTAEERKMFRVTRMHYVIFDEAHMLKNMNTQRYENLIHINAASRLLLTGTPLQNNLLELMSLLIFVMPKIFAEKTEDLKHLFQKNSRISKENDEMPTFEKEQIEQAKRIMKPFVLRRLKRDVLQDLPKKNDFLVKLLLCPTQKEQYDNLVQTFKNASKESSGCSYNGVTMMSDLRKLSNHPLLLRYHYQYEDLPEIAAILAKDPSYKDTKVEYIVDDLAFMSDFEIHTMTKQFPSIAKYALPDNLICTSGKFLYLDKKLNELKQQGKRVLIFSQYVILLNILEEFMKIKEHSYLRLDGSTAVGLRQQLIDEYTQDESIFVFLLSTRAGGLGINLTAADTVIIHDIDFNPYNDKQAEDRCHRMGQNKTVNVYRLISQGTIEEGMWQLNKEKLKLERDITTDESDNPDVKSVVRLLSSVLGIDSSKATSLVSPAKKNSS